MAHKSANFVEQLHVGFTGTGEYTDASASVPSTMRSIAGQLATGDTAYFVAQGETSGGDATEGREVFLGTKTATGVARTTILDSTNGGAAVSWASAAQVRLSLTAVAQRVLQLDGSLTAMLPQVGSGGATVPPTGFMGLFAKSIGGRLMPAFIGASGLDSALQTHILRNGASFWIPSGDGTTITAIGANALTATGTATAANYATTSLHTRSTRIDYLVTTAATTAVAGYRAATNKWRGTEGYHHISRVSPATGGTVSTRRFFAGVQGSTSAPTDVNPSTLTNIIGYGYDAADTNWQFIRNDAGTAVKVSTGTARPSTDRPGLWSVNIFVPPGGAEARVQLMGP